MSLHTNVTELDFCESGLIKYFTLQGAQGKLYAILFSLLTDGGLSESFPYRNPNNFINL